MTTSARRLLVPVALLSILASTGHALATTQAYCSFQPGTTFTYNGSAFAAQSQIRLTTATATAAEAGSAFLTVPIALPSGVSFHAYFRFKIGPNASGGDGVAFVVQNNGPTSLGGAGVQMGYGGINQSVTVEFDTFSNVGEVGLPDAGGGASNHVAVTLNGLQNAHKAVAVPPFVMAGAAGALSGWVDYDASTSTPTLRVYVAQTTTKPASPLLSYAVNILSQFSNNQMYVGFTAGTAGIADGGSPEYNEHDILEFELSTDGIPCGCEGDPACAPVSATTPACGAFGYCAACSATNRTACTGVTPICSVADNTCVGCLKNTDCGASTPICDTTARQCRACNGNLDCAVSLPQCVPSGAGTAAGTCVQCWKDSQCPGSAPICNTTTNVCVKCLTNANCGGNYPVCSGGLCKACSSDTDCSGNTPACEPWGACGQCTDKNDSVCAGNLSICDYPTGTCVSCEFNSDCAGSTPACDGQSHTCRACASNADCVNNPSGSGCATTGPQVGSCVPCAQDSDCTNPATPRCDVKSYSCVACLSATAAKDCAGSTPVCNGSHLCVECEASSDCTGGRPVCDSTTSTCKACQNDFSASAPGPLACATAAAPACQPTNSPLAGQCATCSSLNESACAPLAATPVCIPTAATCGCAKDADCAAGSYCDTGATATGACKAGCRAVAGQDGGPAEVNCATGEYCDKTDGTVGGCQKQPCNTNDECKQKDAGAPICNTIAQPHVCAVCLNDSDCPTGQLCDSKQQCAECVAGHTRACSASGTGAVCLSTEKCGCTKDEDCNGGTGVRACDTSTHLCVAGCRGSGGATCTPPDVCSSTDTSMGFCAPPGSSSSSSSSSSSGTTHPAGGAGGGGPALVEQSVGGGCSLSPVGTRSNLGEVLGIVALVGMWLSKRSRKGDPRAVRRSGGRL